MPITLVRVWLNDLGHRQELRFDWSNDRHHAVEVPAPHGVAQVVKALVDASWLIRSDLNLEPSA